MYIYGKNVCREKISTEGNINRAFISKNFKDQELINSLKNKNIRINFVDNKILDNKVTGLHQGIILEVDEFKTTTIEEFFESIKNTSHINFS